MVNIYIPKKNKISFIKTFGFIILYNKKIMDTTNKKKTHSPIF
jgi:hypothetical protein